MINKEKVQKSIELRNVMHMIGKLRQRHCTIGELKPAEKHFIFMLSNVYEGKPAKPSELAKALGVTLSAVSHHINNLEKAGYIERIQDPKDRRIVRICLSEKGIELDRELKEKFFKGLCEMVTFLGEEDSDELIRILNKISSFLDTYEEYH